MFSEDSLSPTARLIIFGIGQSNVEKIKASISYTLREVGGSVTTTDRELEDNLRENYIMVSGMAVGAGSALAMKRLSEEFSFVTQPSMAVSAKIMGDYSSLIMHGIGRAQEIKYDYGRVAGGIAGALTGFAATRIINRVLTARRVAREVNLARRAVQVGRAGLTAAKVTGAAAAGSIGGPAGIAIAIAGFVISEIATEALSRLAMNLIEDHAEKLALQEIAPGFFDRQRIVDDFEVYKGVMSEMNGTPYEVFDRVLGNRNLEAYGFDYARMSGISRDVITQGRGDVEGYMVQAMELESLYGKEMVSTMTNLSRVVLGGEIEEATKAFERFFLSLAGDGKPQASQLALVDDLVAFANSYGQGQKFNLSSTSAIASISQFLQPVFGDRQTIAPLQTVVTGVDSVLSQGIGYDNKAVVDLLALSGIKYSEALLGVTDDVETFNKFLGGVVRKTGVGYDNFDENGKINSEDTAVRLYRYLSNQLHMDNKTIQALIPALKSYVEGNRGTEIRGTYIENMSVRKRELDNFALTPLISEFSRGARMLSSVVLANASIMNNLDDAFMRAYAEKVPGITGSIARLATTLTNKIDPGAEYFQPDPLIHIPRLAPFNGLATTAVIQGAGYTDTRLQQLPQAVQDFVLRSSYALAGGTSFRVTGVGGLRYDSSDPRLSVINYGTDVVISGSGVLYFPFKSGKVVFVGQRTNRAGENSYGLSIVIDLGDNYYVSYSHLSRSLVTSGQLVRYGDMLGIQGSSGKVTGAHVDIEYHYGKGSMVGGHFTSPIMFDLDEINKHFRKFLFDNDNTSGYNEIHIEADIGVYDQGDYASYMMNALESLNA